MRKLPFKGLDLAVVTNSTDCSHCLLVKQVLPILGYRDTDALRRRVGEDAIAIHDGLPVVKVRALVDLALSRRRTDAEDFGEWLIDQFGDEPDRLRWAARQKRLGVKAPRDELTLGQLCAALGVRADHRADLHNALRAASDAVCSVGLPGFSLGGDRFTSGVLVALATRSVVAARAALSPGQVRALRALSKAMSSGERMSEEQLAAVLEGEDEVMQVQ